MKHAKCICKLCKKALLEKDEFCPDCGPQGKKIQITLVSKKIQ